MTGTGYGAPSAPVLTGSAYGVPSPAPVVYPEYPEYPALVEYPEYPDPVEYPEYPEYPDPTAVATAAGIGFIPPEIPT